MQRGWERRVPFLHLSPEELTQRLQRPLPGARVVAAEPLPRGLRNSSYRAQLAGMDRAVAVRLYMADPSACRKELALARLLPQDVPTPRWLGVDPDASPPLAVLEWIDGEPFDLWLATAPAGQIAAASHSAGQALARIHKVCFPEVGFLGPELEIVEPFITGGAGWAAYIEMFLFRRHVATYLGPALTRRLLDLVKTNAGRLDILKDDRSLVHADYKPQNLIVAPTGGGWAVSGVLDWEFAFAGSPLLDVGLFLRSERVWHPAYREGFEAGYRAAGGQLPADWRDLALLLDLLSLCSLLDNLGGLDNVVHDVRVLIGETLEILQRS